MDQLKLPKDTTLAGKVIEGHYQNEQAKIDRGPLGRIFGSQGSVPANVVAVISVTSAVVLTASIVFWAGSSDFSYKDAVSALSGLVTLTVGYLFGRSSKD
jgi:hypothetical protein